MHNVGNVVSCLNMDNEPKVVSALLSALDFVIDGLAIPQGGY